MVSYVSSVLVFIVALIISAVIIYVVTASGRKGRFDYCTYRCPYRHGDLHYRIFPAWPGIVSGSHCRDRMADRSAVPLQNRLDQVPAGCCSHMDSHDHCRIVPANIDRSGVKKKYITGMRRIRSDPFFYDTRKMIRKSGRF